MYLKIIFIVFLYYLTRGYSVNNTRTNKSSCIKYYSQWGGFASAKKVHSTPEDVFIKSSLLAVTVNRQDVKDNIDNIFDLNIPKTVSYYIPSIMTLRDVIYRSYSKEQLFLKKDDIFQCILDGDNLKEDTYDVTNRVMSLEIDEGSVLHKISYPSFVYLGSYENRYIRVNVPSLDCQSKSDIQTITCEDPNNPDKTMYSFYFVQRSNGKWEKIKAEKYSHKNINMNDRYKQFCESDTESIFYYMCSPVDSSFDFELEFKSIIDKVESANVLVSPITYMNTKGNEDKFLSQVVRLLIKFDQKINPHPTDPDTPSS